MRKPNQFNLYYMCCQYAFCWHVKVRFQIFSKLKFKKKIVKVHLLLRYLVKLRNNFLDENGNLHWLDLEA